MAYLGILTVERGCLENDDLESDDLENNDLENDDLENNDLENDDLENDDLKKTAGRGGLNRSVRNAPSPNKFIANLNVIFSKVPNTHANRS